MRKPYGYYVVIGEIIVDINDLDIYMLSEEDLESLDEFAVDYPDGTEFVEEYAQHMHKNNMETEFKNMTNILNQE